MNDTKIKNSLLDSLNQPSSATQPKAKKQGEIGKDEFLQLLITQLKNQDPMDPMKNDQFAVDMAQFTQVEQLMSINEKLEKSSGTDMQSLAAYLGREVSLRDSEVTVKDNNGGRLKINLPGNATSLKVDLLNPDGSVSESIDLGAQNAGTYSVELNDLQSTDGNYKFRVSATAGQGRPMEVKASVAGIVSGFVPGPEPKLLIGSREISTNDITEVGIAPG